MIESTLSASSKDKSEEYRPGRQYITSFTTTTTTTIRPGISKGVEIIRNLVEQAQVTPPLPTGSVQSLTTIRAPSSIAMTPRQRQAPRSTTPSTTSTSSQKTTTTSATTTALPPNHRSSPIDFTTFAQSTTVKTTRRTPPSRLPYDSEELLSSSTTRPSRGRVPNKTEREKANVVSERPIGIDDINELLNKLTPSTTTARREKPTTTTTARTTTTTTSRPRTTKNAQDDIDFLLQVVS